VARGAGEPGPVAACGAPGPVRPTRLDASSAAGYS